MKISIAMASFNGEPYILQQLQSFADQTVKPDEVVISDDCSTDDTTSIVETFAASSPFAVRLYRNARNIGYIRNFENALQRVSGDVVFLSDQDDVWFPGKIERVVKAFADGANVHHVVNDQEICDGDLRPVGTTKMTNIAASGGVVGAMITGCCTAISAPLVRICLPFPEGIPAHDVWIGRLASALDVRSAIEEPLQLYRRHGSNVSNAPESDLPGRARRRMAYRRLRVPDVAREAEEYLVAAAVIGRMKDRYDAVSRIAGGDMQQNVDRLVHHAEALARRLDVLGIPPPRRLPAIWRLWSQGGYRRSNGWKSAVRDIFR